MMTHEWNERYVISWSVIRWWCYQIWVKGFEVRSYSKVYCRSHLLVSFKHSFYNQLLEYGSSDYLAPGCSCIHVRLALCRYSAEGSNSTYLMAVCYYCRVLRCCLWALSKLELFCWYVQCLSSLCYFVLLKIWNDFKHLQSFDSGVHFWLML